MEFTTWMEWDARIFVYKFGNKQDFNRFLDWAETSDRQWGLYNKIRYLDTDETKRELDKIDWSEEKEDDEDIWDAQWVEYDNEIVVCEFYYEDYDKFSDWAGGNDHKFGQFHKLCCLDMFETKKDLDMIIWMEEQLI